MAFFTGVEHERDGNGIVRLNGVAEHSIQEQAKKLNNQIFERGCLNQSVLMDGVTAIMSQWLEKSHKILPLYNLNRKCLLWKHRQQLLLKGWSD